jgi:hypothetical protein
MTRRFALLLVGAAAIVSVAACRESKQITVQAGPSVADSAEQVLFVAHYFLTTRGVLRGDLTADTAYVLDDQTRFDLRKAHVNFTSETGAPQGTMDAKRGVYNTNARGMGRRARQACGRTHTEIAARDVQSSDASDRERHVVHAHARDRLADGHRLHVERDVHEVQMPT